MVSDGPMQASCLGYASLDIVSGHVNSSSPRCLGKSEGHGAPLIASPWQSGGCLLGHMPRGR